MAIDRITRDTAKALQQEAEDAMQALARRHGLTLKPKTTRFGVDHVVVGFEFVAVVGGVDPAKREWDRYCHGWGLKPEDFGRTFISGGNSFTICGIKPRAKRFPVLARCEETGNHYGKLYKFSARAAGLAQDWETMASMG